MKQVSDELATLLSNSNEFMSCDLYELTLQSGLAYYWSDTDVNVYHKGHTYKGNGPIITRNKISTSSDISVDKLTVTVSCDKRDTIEDTPIMAVAHNGGLDNAKLHLSRAFFSKDGKVVDSIDLFTGLVEVSSGGGLSLKINAKSIVQKLTTEWPCKRYYPQCPYTVYGKECGLDINKYKRRVHVLNVHSTNTVTFNTEFADDYFNAGGIEWLTGPLVGQNTQIISSEDNRITFISPLNHSVAIGDEAYIYPGCDKTPDTCKHKFNNFSRNRATPYVPLKETIR